MLDVIISRRWTFGRHLGHESIALMNGIIKEEQRNIFGTFWKFQII
jgi:hypothetical protein